MNQKWEGPEEGGGASIARRLERWTSTMAQSTGQRSGSWRRIAVQLVFNLQKARGDVKVKGRPDPYAYVPLLGQKLNRRKKARLAGQFQGLVRGARAGAATGSRLRGRKK